MQDKFSKQSGQTLIETLVASIVLVMGISAAVGLAIYGLSASTTVNKQLIASGLAREGIEAVKNMRDTNWLRTAADTNCFDFYTQSSIGVCHKSWLNISGGYNIDPGSSSQTYALGLTANGTNNYWNLIPTATAFGLDTNSSDQSTGLYSSGASGVTVSNSNTKFGRMITISKDTFAPFDHSSDLGPRIKVRVDVWWNDKRCAVSDTLPTNSDCTVSLETYLTNWKNY
jgi:type II secretory pathway pseudopilin PulG